MHLGDLLTVTVAGTAAIICPGPDFLIVTRHSLLYSKRAGVFTALGIFAGILWWVTASVAGLSYLISTTALLFNAIKWIGGAYLVYIGIKALRSEQPKPAPAADASVAAPAPVPAPKAMSSWAAFRIGLLTNVLNPKAALFFLSFFSLIIRSDTTPGVRFAYGIELSIIALIWFCLVATLFSTELIKGFFDRIAVWFGRVTGAIFIAFGLKLAFSQAK